MSLQRISIFENDTPMGEQVKKSVEDIAENPRKFCSFFWFFFIQICLAIFLLITSILMPIRIFYGG